MWTELLCRAWGKPLLHACRSAFLCPCRSVPLLVLHLLWLCPLLLCFVAPSLVLLCLVCLCLVCRCTLFGAFSGLQAELSALISNYSCLGIRDLPCTDLSWKVTSSMCFVHLGCCAALGSMRQAFSRVDYMRRGPSCTHLVCQWVGDVIILS